MVKGGKAYPGGSYSNSPLYYICILSDTIVHTIGFKLCQR